MEEWKIINKLPKYEVSNTGKVRRVSTNKLLYQKDHPAGYKQVVIQSEGKKYYLYVHRLVAEAFIPNPMDLPYINHKDEDKSNNNRDNLEWCTPKYNANYGTIKEKMSLAKSKPVKQYTRDGVFIREWKSCTQAEEELGIAKGNISKYINSEYHWELVTLEPEEEYANI